MTSMSSAHTAGMLALESCGYTLTSAISDYERYDTDVPSIVVEFSSRGCDVWRAKVARISKIAAFMSPSLIKAVEMRMAELNMAEQ